MDKKISSLIQKYADNELQLNKLVVSAFAKFNKIRIESGYLSSFIADKEEALDEDINTLSTSCSIENVISIFELAIPKSEKTSNGAIYTPKYIRDYIVRSLMCANMKPLETCLCADISCGCGAFLFTLLDQIHEHTHKPYKQILHNIYGVDISAISIGRAKILLALVAHLNNEIVESEDFRLYCGDSLTYDFMSMPGVKENNGLDIIVGNPPYVRSKHIDLKTKNSLSLWSTSRIGNADLYIPFFEIGLSILNENGHLGYITVNTFFKSVNARALRNYLTHNHISLSIIDFGEQLVFKKKLAYTCLVFLSKKHCESLNYVKAGIEDIQNQHEVDYNIIKYNSLDNHRGWHLNKSDVLANIRLIESAGESLGEKYVIKNGIATLANDIFIFRPNKEDELYYYFIKNNSEIKIEKNICRDIIKPNILKKEEEIPEKEEKIIYPYDAGFNVIREDIFIKNYPYAYKYLTSCRVILDARDKGKGDFGAWYAYGRTQAISDRGKKLLFPYMSDIPHFVYTSNIDMLVYCGYAIFHESEKELLFLKRLLESCVFDYYMRNTSKPYSTGYYSYAKNYVKNFGIYPFSEEQKKYVLSLCTKAEVDEFVCRLYNIMI